MLATREVLKFSAVALLLTIGACAGVDEPMEPPTAEGQGYEWVGPGEPTNFGADYTYCRNLVATRENVTAPDPYRPGGVQAARTDEANVRRLQSCLLGRGWKQV